MKLADLTLDTIYADRNGHPLMVLSLDRFALVKRSHHFGEKKPVRAPRPSERASGVLVLTAGWNAETRDHDTLRANAARLQADLPAYESRTSQGQVHVVTLASIVSTWEDHLAAKRAEGEACHAANLRKQAAEEARAVKIARVQALLPDGLRVRSSVYSDDVTCSLDTMLAILEAGR